MIDAAMSGMLSTVPVTSRSAYSRLSAGAIRAVCPISASPQSRRTARKRASSRFTSKPGIASSLSSVPPVWPRPRPEIIGTDTPHAATAGARCSEILSPTPPVECLSTLAPGMSDRSSTSPECSIASVSARQLGAVEAAEEDRHQQRRRLVVGDAAVGHAAHERPDLLGRQRAAVALAADQLDDVHRPVVQLSLVHRPVVQLSLVHHSVAHRSVARRCIAHRCRRPGHATADRKLSPRARGASPNPSANVCAMS